ncbi:MAG TPA: tetratricopeptide repeat protein, partial [Sphingomonas sp.]|nr:tetratricopeptide repeat protein [Sphingomonas sp.]
MAEVLAAPPARQRRWRIDARTLAVAILLAVAAVAIIGRVGPRGADARQSLVDALTTLDAGNFSAARNHAQAAVRAAPDSGMAHAILARAYLQLGEGLAAESELARAREAGMPEVRLHQLAAHAAFLQGDDAGAIAQAARAAPRYANYAGRIEARARAAQGATTTAVASLERLTARNPGDAAAWTDLGRVRLSAGDIGGATVASARAVALAPRDPVALTLRGEVVRTRLGLIAALPWFEAALRRDAYYHPALIEYAATLGDAGRYREMLAATRRAQAARPGSPQAFYLQAVLAARANRLDLARDLLGRTGGVLDDLPGAVLLSGSLDLAQGKNEQAIAMYRRVVDLQPLNVGARRLLGVALLRSGDPAGARATLAPIATRSDADAYALTVAARAFEAGGDREGAAILLDRVARASGAPAAVFASDTAVAAVAAGAARAPD